MTACAACDSSNRQEPTTLVPIIGMVCGSCLKKLSRQLGRHGSATVEVSLVELCELAVVSFEKQRQRLRQQAREMCEDSPSDPTPETVA